MMRKNVCMRLKCVECKAKYDIPAETIDDYNIYYYLGEHDKAGIPWPHLLCPKCTEKR